MRSFAILLLSPLLLMLMACRDSSLSHNSEAILSPSANAIMIEYPLDGAIIYGETIHISGIAGSAIEEFAIRLVDIEGNSLGEVLVNTEDDTWDIELPHRYAGDPTEITIQATSTTHEGAIVLASRVILLTDLTHRPEGVFGNLLFPSHGLQVGGEVLQVSGRISGTDVIMVEWLDDFNRLRETLELTLVNPNLVDDIPWQAEITFDDFTGQALIRATAADGDKIVQLGEARITVIRAAG